MTVEVDHDRAVTLQGHYAGAVSRLAAYAVDQSLLTAVFSVGIGVATWTVDMVTRGEVELRLPNWLLAILYGLWWLSYFAYPWWMSGKTAGMALLGIRVVAADGSPCTLPRAVTRAITFPLGFLTLGIGFLGILVGRRRSAIYDRIAGTAVVYAWDARAARWRFLARRAEGPAPVRAG